mmetsp:Transcript_32985/g.60411  ORF Transcript_32985/g.60411 Transcript_32985/m.60411 type:complete len:491 (+) Transcript_32985:69-1541(+)
MGCPWRCCLILSIFLRFHAATAAGELPEDKAPTTERALQHEDEHKDLPGTASAARQGTTFSYHKGLLPLDGKDVLCFSLAVVGLIIAAGGGIGGGGILVPLYMLLLGFRPKHGIALANLTILGGAVANVWFNCSRRLPSGRSMIDWDIILIMEPSTIAGAVVGSFLSKKLPDFVLTVSMAFMLLFLALRTLEKGVTLFKKESSAMAERALEQSGREGRDTALVEAAAIEHQRSPEDVQDEEEQLLKKAHGGSAGGHEVPLVPCTKVLTLIVCILGTVALTILKGGGEHGSPIGIECGSPGFWVLSLALLPWIAVFLCMFRRMLLAENAEKVQANHRFEDGEIEWNAKRTILYPAVCTIAGVMAGLFGVGGGIVKGPLMLEMGVAPKVAAATAATMILFTTTATCVSFAVFGILEPQYGCALFLIGLLSTALGQLLTEKWMSRAGRQSPPVLSIGAVMLLSVVFIVIECIEKVSTEDISELLKTSTLCSST